jgi:hypothetical protein
MPSLRVIKNKEILFHVNFPTGEKPVIEFKFVCFGVRLKTTPSHYIYSDYSIETKVELEHIYSPHSHEVIISPYLCANGLTKKELKLIKDSYGIDNK